MSSRISRSARSSTSPARCRCAGRTEPVDRAGPGAAKRRSSARCGGRTAPSGAGRRRAQSSKPPVAEIGAPAILKTLRLTAMTARARCASATRPRREAAWEEIGERPAILEGFVTFSHEFSIITGARPRRRDGQLSAAAGTSTSDGILDRSSLPAPAEIARHWTEAARARRARRRRRSAMSAC